MNELEFLNTCKKALRSAIHDCEINAAKHHSEWMKVYTGMIKDNYRQAVIFANKRTRELRS